MVDVCLVLMPYAAVERPSIALGLLKAALTKDSIDATAIYANIWFAKYIGLSDYNHNRYIRLAPFRLIGEWTFSQTAFPDFQADDEKFLELITPNLVEGKEEISTSA